jgi:hypothetical protein
MRGEETTVEAGAPGGWRLRLSGADSKALLLGLLVLFLAASIYVTWEEDRRVEREARAMYLQQHKHTQSLLGVVINNQQQTFKMLDDSRRESKGDIAEITYVLTLTPSARESLRLEMPSSLRRRIGFNGGDRRIGGTR